jgi:hypothetical protein
MKIIYELWDYETGNLIDACDTEQAAPEEIRGAVHDDGPDTVATWALLRDDRKSPAKMLIATGADLAAYATETHLKAV